MFKFIRTEGFKTRLIVSLGIMAIFIPGYYLYDARPLRLVLVVGFSLAILEIIVTAARSIFFPNIYDAYLAEGLGVALLISAYHVLSVSHEVLGTAIIACVATDVGAYLVGNLLGKKIFERSPFPKTSPNKTWEGSIGGILIGLAATYLWSKNVKFLWMVPVAFIGDLLESRFKRRYGVKDSNDYFILSENPVERFIAGLLGGRNGHGGFFDRLDSLSLVIFMEAVLSFLSY